MLSSERIGLSALLPEQFVQRNFQLGFSPTTERVQRKPL